jgi:eukaryotic-like serine/threonine-protein kinase
MGYVYLALDTRLGRQVALKFLPPELTADPTYLHRFQQEARTASALNHPNILTIFDFAEISGQHMIVSEFVDGVTLQTALERRMIDQESGLDIVTQIASALVAAHAAGVIHRDLKPANVMIRPDGYVKVIDFGLAKLLERSHPRRAAEQMLTRPGVVLGTIGYLSPEQARSEDVDQRTDIWSLGVILYEVLTRQRPFGGRSDSHVLVSILDDPPRAVPDSIELPPGVAAIIDRALQKDPNQRYRSVRQMLADLESVPGSRVTRRATKSVVVRSAKGADARHQSEKELANPSGDAPNPATVLREFLRRRNRSFGPWMAGLIVVLLAAFSVWWWPLNGRWKVLSPHWFELGTPQRVTFAGDVSNATISPDGRQLAYVTGEPQSETLHLLDLSSHAERALPSAFDTHLGLSFSPDSKILYYVLRNRQQERGRLFEISVAEFASAPPGLVLEDLDGPIAISHDGSQFAFFRGRAEGDRSVQQILLGNQASFTNVKPVLSLTDTQIGPELAWSPNDNWLVARIYPRRLDQPTRAMVTLVTPGGRIARTFSPPSLRGVRSPVVLDGGNLILFSGVPQNAEQSHLIQLSVPAAQFHEVPSDILGFESLSVTADGKTLASLREDRRSSIWLAKAENLEAPTKLTPDSESISSLTWSDDGDLIYPSARSGNVNLVRLHPADLSMRNVASPEPYVEHQPAFAFGRDLVVYSSNRALGGDDFNLWSVSLRTENAKRLTSGSNYDEEPAVSPDGSWVFYTSWAANLRYVWKAPVEGGPPVQLSQTQAWAPAVSPDGKKVACFLKENSRGIEVGLLSAQDGAVLERFPQIPVRDRPARDQVEWSPDGTALDYIVNNKEFHGIQRQSLEGGSPRALVHLADAEIGAFAWSPDGRQLAYIRSREQRDVFLFPRDRSH